MGRRYVVRREPTTSITVNLVDSLLVDDEKNSSDKSKTDTVRRIFIEYFGENVVKAKLEEVRKKVDRQELIHGDSHGDQSRLDGVYFPKRTLKDMVYSKMDLVDIVVEAKQYKGALAKARALDSINKAINRGDVENAEGGYRIIRRYWEGLTLV